MRSILLREVLLTHVTLHPGDHGRLGIDANEGFVGGRIQGTLYLMFGSLEVFNLRVQRLCRYGVSAGTMTATMVLDTSFTFR